jgi:predicted permease
MILVSGFIVAVWVVGYLLSFLLQRFAMQEERGLPEGGLHIGFFERAIIFIFVLAGQPAGIGFLVAAKSVFRFGELKDREDRAMAEYILIGTLMSFTFAMIVAYATRYLLGHLP